MKIRDLLFTQFLSAVIVSFTDAVKFPSQNGITIGGDALRVGQFVEVSCNFIKFKQEDISKVEWSIQYDGVSTNAFTSHLTDGRKEIVPSEYFAIDENSSGEKVMHIRLNDEREDEINICCLVESIRDSGYGMVKRYNKQKCSAVSVQFADDEAEKPSILVRVNKDLVRIGETVPYTCEVDNVRDGNLQLAVFVNANPLERKQLHRYDKQIKSSYIVTEDVFYEGQGEKFFLECVLYKGDYEVGREALTIKRDRSSQILPTYPGLSVQDPVQARRGRVQNDPKFHADHGSTPCHSYIILEEGTTQGSVIKGDLPLSIQGSISAHRNHDSSYETGEGVITVLNALGFHGYRVVGMANNMLNRITWTLEKPQLEFHPNQL